MPEKASNEFDSLFPSGPDDRGRYWVFDMDTLVPFVLRDLQNGNLESFGKYLKECGGIIDASIFRALKAMILGGPKGPDFCLVTARNPNLPNARKTKRKQLEFERLCMDYAVQLYENMQPGENALSRVDKVRGRISERAYRHKALKGKKLLSDPKMRARRILQSRFGLDADDFDLMLQAALQRVGAKVRK